MINIKITNQLIEKVKKNNHKLIPICTLIVIYYIFSTTISQVSRIVSKIIHNDWTPELRKLLKESYNEAFVTYICIILVTFVFITYKYSFKSEIKRNIKNYLYKNTKYTAIISLILLIINCFHSPQKYISELLLLTCFVVLFVNSIFLLQKTKDILSGSYLKFNLLMVLAMLASTYLLVNNWYPIKIPNNYQFIDKIFIDKNNENIKQSDLEVCARKKNDDFKYSELVGNQNCKDIELKLLDSLEKTSKIEISQDGIFYHHSFIYLPALNIINYGLNNKFPYLYGIGNTYFTSVLLLIVGENWSGYFKSYPFGQLIGLISIMLLILALTKNAIPTLISGLIVLFILGIIKYEYILLAPGFSPIRYVGICIQLIALNYYNDSSGKHRIIILLISSALGIIWNFELGVIGIIVQISFVLMKEKLSDKYKILNIIILVCILILGTIFTKYVTGNYIQTMHLAIFGLFPYLNTFKFLILISVLSIYIYIYIKLIKCNFNGDDLKIRYSFLILSLLVFSKYIFYPAKVHLYASIIMPIILLLTAFNWKKTEELYQSYYIKLLIIIVSILTIGQSYKYHLNAKRYIDLTINNFVNYQWHELGDTFLTTIPEEKILKRINIIKQNTFNSDILLILSPYDHILSSYINPKNLCGHFELNLNLLTFSDINKVKKCVEEAGDVLVIYDEELDNKCDINKYPNEINCKVYNLTKFGPKAVFDILKINLENTKSDGPLKFYKYTK